MLADYIAQMIEEMLNESNGNLELRRNEMAAQLGCVPSQISYVISSRFTPERGYIIESRRGGGGCIRIIRKQLTKDEYLMHFFYAIGEKISETEAIAYAENLRDSGVFTPREAYMICHAISNSALTVLPRSMRDVARASILKHVLLSFMN
jgi:transcriptional regulator CtsR